MIFGKAYFTKQDRLGPCRCRNCSQHYETAWEQQWGLWICPFRGVGFLNKGGFLSPGWPPVAQA
jgi:hypothetical protein